MKKRIFAYLVIGVLVVILTLSYKFYTKKILLLDDSISVNLIKSEEQSLPKIDGFNYYHEPLPNLKTQHKPPWVKYDLVESTNSDSLKDRYDYQLNKDARTYRIEALGDSFTYGLNISTPDVWPEKLEDMLNKKLKCKNYDKFEVINLGVGGYDIQYELERFKNKGEKYNPDMVVWMVLDNDFDYIEEDLAPILKKYRKLLANEDKKVSNWINDKVYNYGYDIYGKALNDFYKIQSKELVQDYQKKKLYDLRSYYKNSLIFFGMDNRLVEERNINAINELVKNRKNSKFYYMKVNSDWHTEDSLPDNHPNIKGQQVIASELFKYLTENYLINCKNL